MTTRIHTVQTARKTSRSLGVVSALTLVGLTLATAHCADQPKVRCAATSGEVIARYRVPGATKWPTPGAPGVNPDPKDPTLVVPTGTCTGVASPTRGEPLGIQTYVPNPSDSNAHDEVNSIALKAERLGERIFDARTNATDEGQNPDIFNDKATLAELLNYPYGTASPPDPPPEGTSTSFPYAFGKFDTTYPGSDDVCAASAVSPSDLTYPIIPAHNAPDPDADPAADPPAPWISVDEQAATSVKYAWSNVRVVVNADSIGTQTFADLTITQDGCSIAVQASILSPRVGCEGADKKGNPIADVTLCSPFATDTNPYGSGIGEDIPVDCVDIADHNSTDADPKPDFECVPTKFAP